MQVKIIGKNIDITESMRDVITEKVKKLEKYSIISDEDVAKVLIKTHKNSQKVEITIPTKMAILRAEVRDANAYPALDKAIDKLSDQIRRQKTKIEKRKRTAVGTAVAFAEMEERDNIIRTKTVHVSPMDVDDAVMQMELLGHDFFAYLDTETQQVSIVYKRHDGEYGVLETDAA